MIPFAVTRTAPSAVREAPDPTLVWKRCSVPVAQRPPALQAGDGYPKCSFRNPARARIPVSRRGEEVGGGGVRKALTR